MADKTKATQTTNKSANEKYLSAVFSILKRRDGITLANRKTHFNDTELRLIGEVLDAKIENKRLISTQLATKLNVTRSAISQIVNRLEKKGVVKRVPDAIDRKIAYIEITEEMLASYKEDVEVYGAFIGGLVKEFGEDRFEQMCALMEEFLILIEKANRPEPITRRKYTRRNFTE
jgi:DNA-binding MarR family transcriptional regulator